MENESIGDSFFFYKFYKKGVGLLSVRRKQKVLRQAFRRICNPP